MLILSSIEQTLVVVALVLLVSVLASKAAARSGVPVLILFILLGVLIGSEGIGWIELDNAELVQSLGVTALVVILFAGGLDTRWRDIYPVWREGVVMATGGIVITALAVGAFAHYVVGFSWTEGILLGAIMSSTDAAAVFSVLRGQGIALKGRLKSLLELESGSNDPMAVFLTLAMIQLIIGNISDPLMFLPLLVLQMSLGAGMGYLFGQIALLGVNRLKLEYDGLYPVLTVSVMFLTYGATTLINGNGFLAVYIAGLIMGRSDFIHKNSLIGFHDGLAWLMQIVMFLSLGLQVFPSEVGAVAGAGVLLAAFLIFVARPLSVFIALLPFNFNRREKLFISWVGLRGAAPIILATFPLLAGLSTAAVIFNLVFFVVMASVLLQGTLIVWVARTLGVLEAQGQSSLLAWIAEGRGFSDNLMELVVTPNCQMVGQQVLDLQLPSDVLLVLIGRQNEVITPRGKTIIQAGDHVLVMARPEQHELVRRLLT